MKIAKLKTAGQCRGRRPTVLNKAVSYRESRARENTAECREAKLTRAIERRRNTRQIDPEHCRIRASRCRAAEQEKSHDKSGEKRKKSNVLLRNYKQWTWRKTWLIPWSIEKISSVQASQLLLQVSARKAGRSELPTCGKWLLLWR